MKKERESKTKRGSERSVWGGGGGGGGGGGVRVDGRTPKDYHCHGFL